MNRTEYIELLCDKKDWQNSVMAARIQEIVNGAECKNQSKLIDYLKALPYKQELNSDPVTEIGIYRNELGIFKVNLSKNSGNLYAIKLVSNGFDCGGCDNGEFCGANCKETYSWNYDETPKGAIYKLHSADKLNLSLDEMREFGAAYNYCGICGKPLSNEISVKLGIGPVCGNREYGMEFKILEKDARKLLKAEKATNSELAMV